MDENSHGNPKAVDDNVFGSDGEDFFSALDQDVNGLVQDDEPETKQAATPGIQDPANNKKAETVSQSSEVNTELENLKKRYSDSSREAQQLKAQLDQLKPYAPVLEAMKQDENLVSHVKDYFQKGGQPTDDIRKQLSLEEDFEFDPDEMVSNPNSDSRKVFDSMVNNIVNKKANEVVNQQRAAIAQSQQQQTQAAQAKEFMEKHGMTKVEFQEFAREAQAKIANGGITYDDAADGRVQTILGVPVHVSDFLSNDEACDKDYGSGYGHQPTDGTALGDDDNSTSIFALQFGPKALSGVQSMPITVEKFAKLETKDAARTRIKWYPSIMVQSIISCAKLTGLQPAGTVTS